MANIKVSIVTVVRNRANIIAHAISSVKAQNYPLIEHVIIDGASTDGTLDVIQGMISPKTIFVSEPDQGIYDALNKGISYSTGDVIGVLHSDDYFSDDFVISEVAKQFEDPSVDIVYGDLDYVSKTVSGKIIRHWEAGKFSDLKLSWGWMPPHPTVFIRRSILDIYGLYDINYKISGDYDFLLRYFRASGTKSIYLQRVLVKMRFGGESNKSLDQILRKMNEDYHALCRNKVGGIGALLWKNISKIPQYL